MKLFTFNASAIRSLIRAGLLLLTAFGLSMTADQVAAIMLFTEALMGLGVATQQRLDAR